MNDFEHKIKKALKKEVEKPLSYEYTIKNAFSRKKEKTRKSRILKLATITSCLVMVCTGVMATTYIIDKIWENPVVISQEQEENKIREEISEEEKSNFINEDKAIEIANEIIKKLGYENITISDVNLKRGYNQEYVSHYILKTNDILINLNPKNGKLEYFGDTSVINKDIKCDEISEENIRKIATNIFNVLEIANENSNDEIVNVQKTNMVSGEKINTLYEVNFAKVINGNYDKSSVSTICFGVYNGDILISSITGIRESNFENNPVIITQEEAIEIATNKEKQFSNLEITNIDAKLSIEKMNVFIYCLENNITNENGELKIEDVSRNVWVVNIKHHKETKPKDGEIETVKELYNKKYFIDTTTGEIIGGEQSEFFQ